MEITKEYIKNQQYKKTDYLQSRINLHNCFSNYSFHRWVYSKLPITKPVKVLQVGCGIGQFWAENYYKFPKASEIILTDISQAMIKECEQRLSFMENTEYLVRDADKLPYPDNSFDIVMAHHIIYHTDITKSMSEISRLIKKDGFASITTNSEKHMLNVFEVGQKLSPNFPKDRHIDTFVEEKADNILASYFKDIKKFVSIDTLKVTDASFVTDFIRSEVEARQTGLGEDFYQEYNLEVNNIIKKNVFYEIPKRSPLYICRNSIEK